MKHWDFEDWADLVVLGIIMGLVFAGTWAATGLILEAI